MLCLKSALMVSHLVQNLIRGATPRSPCLPFPSIAPQGSSAEHLGCCKTATQVPTTVFLLIFTLPGIRHTWTTQWHIFLLWQVSAGISKISHIDQPTQICLQSYPWFNKHPNTKLYSPKLCICYFLLFFCTLLTRAKEEGLFMTYFVTQLLEPDAIPYLKQMRNKYFLSE